MAKNAEETYDMFEEADEFRRSLKHQERRKFDENVEYLQPQVRHFGPQMGRQLVHALMKFMGQAETFPMDIHNTRSQLLYKACKQKMLDDGWDYEYSEECAKRFVNKTKERGDV